MLQSRDRPELVSNSRTKTLETLSPFLAEPCKLINRSRSSIKIQSHSKLIIFWQRRERLRPRATVTAAARRRRWRTASSSASTAAPPSGMGFAGILCLDSNFDHDMFKKTTFNYTVQGLPGCVKSSILFTYCRQENAIFLTQSSQNVGSFF